MADPKLEEYASGIGAGAYSPQQGSGLPVSAQGGLPFGAQSPTPPPAAEPTPSFQRAPLTQLGSQSPVDVADILQQRLQQIAAYNPQTSTWEQQNQHYLAMKDLPALAQVAGIKSQDRQQQAQYLKESAAQLEKFNALPPEQQATMRPFMTGYLRNTAKLAGMNLSEQDLTHALSSPDFAATYGSIVNDPLVGEQERQGYLSRIGAAPAGEHRDKAAQLAKLEIEQRAASLIQSHLPQLVQQLGGSPDKPIDVQTLVTNPQIKQYLDQSPTLKRVFNSFVSDKNNAEALAQWGLKPGKVSIKQMEQQAAGPELTGEVKDVLATMKGPDGKPLTPAAVMALSNGPDLVAKAQQQVFNNKLDVAKAQGYNAIIAKNDAEQNVPIAMVPGMQNVHIVNRQTEQPVDRLTQTIKNVREGGGESKFAVMNEKSYEAFQAAQEAQGILGMYVDLSKALTSTPGANFMQAAQMYAKTRLGIDNPGAGFEAMSGTILRMARAMQGSSQSLSNLDANSVAGMLPTPKDGFPVAIRRLEIANGIVQNMKDVHLGKLSPQDLMTKIAAAKAEVAKISGVDVYKNKETGQTIPIPKGQSHPGKGWEKQ